MKQKKMVLNPQTMQFEVEELGTENIIIVFHFILDIGGKILDLIKRFKLSKAVDLGMDLIEYKNIVNIGKQALKEFVDLSPAESQVIIDAVKEKFILAPEKIDLELRIENGLNLIPRGYALVKSNIQFIGDISDFSRSLRELKVA